MRPVEETEVLTARAHLVSLCDQFEAFLTLNAANAVDADISKFENEITLAARTFAILLHGGRPDFHEEAEPDPPRHLHSV